MDAAVIMRMAGVGQRHSVEFVIAGGHVMHHMPRWRLARVGAGGHAFHRDSRKRLNRQAQCQQHDDEEFAPI